MLIVNRRRLIFALKKRARLEWNKFVEWETEVELSNGMCRHFVNAPNIDYERMYYGK